MSFADMMQQAIKIRVSTDAKLRVDFDARPKFQQASLFASPEVQEAREMPLAERLDACDAMKHEGNQHMRSGRSGEACHAYEQALAIFWYLDNRNKKWKTSGIKDEDIHEVSFTPSGESHQERVRNLKLALLLNIARAYSAQSDYATARKACTVALTVDCSNAKALYLRAKALVCPAEAGAFETEEAIRDLNRAMEIAPGDREIRALRSTLKAEVIRQKKSDRATFAGMFSRGSICDTSSESVAASTHKSPPADGQNSASDGENNDVVKNRGGRIVMSPASCPRPDGRTNSIETRREVEARLAHLERLARECDDEDREEEANDYRERIAAVKNVLLEHDKEKNSARRDHFLGFDWRCPNEALRKKAEEEELDLDNPTVVNFLVKMQEIQCKKDQREAGAGRCGALPGSLSIEDRGANERGGRWPGNTGSGEDEEWDKETCEGAIRCMSRSEVNSLLQDAGIRPVPGMPLAKLRDLAVNKLVTGELGEDSSTTSARGQATVKHRTKPMTRNWKLSMTISLVIVLLKSYQMGLFTWITNAATPEIAQGGFQSGGGSGGRQAGRSIAEKVSSPTANVDGSTENSNSAQAVTASTYSSAHKQGQTRKHFKCSGDNLKNCDGYEFVAERSVSYHDGLEQVRASSGAEATNQLYNKLPLVDVLTTEEADSHHYESTVVANTNEMHDTGVRDKIEVANGCDISEEP